MRAQPGVLRRRLESMVRPANLPGHVLTSMAATPLQNEFGNYSHGGHAHQQYVKKGRATRLANIAGSLNYYDDKQDGQYEEKLLPRGPTFRRSRPGRRLTVRRLFTMKSSDDRAYDQTCCDRRCHYQQNLTKGVVPEQKPWETDEKADYRPTNDPFRQDPKGCHW